MITGAELISNERNRQIEIEGYSQEHDNEHNYKEFISAAISYLMANMIEGYEGYSKIWWPWDKDAYKPKGVIEDLTRAGALLAAAIDRYKLQVNNKD